MSDTPRTDFVEKRWPMESFGEMTGLAVRLERELTAANRRIAELELAASELLAAIQSVEPDVEISPREAVAIMAMKDVLNKPAAKREGGG